MCWVLLFLLSFTLGLVDSGSCISPSLVISRKWLGRNKLLGILEFDHLGMSYVSPPCLFHLTFVLGRVPGKIFCLGKLMM